MATQVQYRRGTGAQNDAFTGALGEITVDTTNGTLRVHNGVTAGGSNIATVSYVTSQISSANAITFGTSNVQIPSSGGNVRVNVGGTSNVAVFTTAGVDVTGNVSAGNLNITGGIVDTGALTIVTGSNGNVAITPNGTGILTVSTATSVTGNVDGGNIRTTGLISATGNITGGNVLGGANVNATTHTGATVSVTGNITGGNVLTSVLFVNTGNTTGAAIVNSGGNGVGNIGSATGFFNIAHVRATSAQYADLAEMYVADADYAPGTVLEFGGSREVTITSVTHSTLVAGIVSTNPSYLMNSTQAGEHVVPVALTGRVPCRVVGIINKGDRLVASDQPGVATALNTIFYQPGCIIGKALEDYSSSEVGEIEVAVGRF